MNKGTISLIISIVSIFIPFLGFFGHIAALIFGIKGLKEEGRGQAIAGIVISTIFLLFSLVFILIMAGGLAYFGVLNPSQMLPDRCSTSDLNIQCSEMMMENDRISVYLVGEGTIQVIDAGDFCTPVNSGEINLPSIVEFDCGESLSYITLDATMEYSQPNSNLVRPVGLLVGINR